MNKLPVEKNELIIDGYNEYIEYSFNGVDILIRKYISPDEQVKFVNNVIDNCLINGEIITALIEFFKRVAVLDFFTNISVPEDADEANKLVFVSDLYDVICDHIDLNLLICLENSINKEIDRLYNHKESVYDLISGFLNNIQKSFNGIDPNQINKLVEFMNKLDSEKISKDIVKTEL